MPKVSVIVPAYNSQLTIADCLRSVLAQSLPADELIVVDDRSGDSTADLARNMGCRVIRNNMAKGPGGARNSGAACARGDILAFIDSDCAAPENWLKKLVSAFEDPSIVAAGGGYSCGRDNSFWQDFSCLELAWRRRNFPPRVKTLVSNNFACRAPAFRQAGGFSQRYPVCEDMLLSSKLSGLGNVAWLADNDIRHVFKSSLPGYLKHQYFFAAESTRFFLGNARILKHENHQGRQVHAAIVLASGFAVLAATALAALVAGNRLFGGVCLALAALAFGLSAASYLSFMTFLKHRGFGARAAAFGVCFMRDMLCGLAAWDGLGRYIRRDLLSRGK